jgi:CheY-like chemotaxis protein
MRPGVLLVCHVLVIEDEPLVAEYIADVAEQAGASSVAFAISEAEAINSAQSCVPDVILSDVDLKAGGHGPTAVAAIREQAGPVPVIFITGTPEACKPCDYAAAILGKPVQPHAIVSAFSTVWPRSA